MKIYLASRWGRKNEMAQLANYLKIWGQSVTSRWIDEPKMDQKEDGNYTEDWHPDSDVAIDVARRDLRSIAGSSHLVLFTDRSRSGVTGGRHCEFGFALAHPFVLTIVVGPRTNPFHYLANYHFEDTHEFMDWVREQTFNENKESPVSLEKV